MDALVARLEQAERYAAQVQSKQHYESWKNRLPEWKKLEARAERAEQALRDVQSSLLAYWTDLSQQEIERLLSVIEAALVSLPDTPEGVTEPDQGAGHSAHPGETASAPGSVTSSRSDKETT